MRLLYRGMWLTAVQIARLEWLEHRGSQKADSGGKK